MDEQTKEQLKEFFKICYSRLEFGQKEYGERYENLDLIKEISQELADISNYAFLQYLKLQALSKKIERLDKADSTIP